jgi:predicted amidohydrolase
VGILICWDIEFPEPARGLALHGAELIIVPTANCDAFINFKTVPVRCRENQVHIAYVNWIGKVNNLEFNGGSVIVDPSGNILAQGPSSSEAAYVDLKDILFIIIVDYLQRSILSTISMPN